MAGSILIRQLLGYGALCMLVSCASVQPQQSEQSEQPQQSELSEQQKLIPDEKTTVSPVNSAPLAEFEPVVQTFFREPPQEPEYGSQNTISRGSGQFVAQNSTDESFRRQAKGKLTLKFKEASLNEFISVVFEKILLKNYLIDQKVQGKVTLHTISPVSQDAILPIIESVLHQNDAALIYQQGVYKIIPIQEAPGQVNAPLVGGRLSNGGAYAMHVVPLQYISASEIEKILAPMMPKGSSSIQIDEARNLLILTASNYRLEQMLDTIKIFDVDWFKGMSFGLFRLQYAEASSLVNELESLLLGSNGKSPLSGIVRLLPIERLNAVMVVTHAPHYIDEVSKLIDQFDWGVEGNTGRRLFVYHLKYSKADTLASVLRDIYEIGGNESPATGGAKLSQLPPGELDNVSRTGPRVMNRPPSSGQANARDSNADAQSTQRAETIAENVSQLGGSNAQESNLATAAGINIIADQVSNSLLVMANPADYRGIESVIKQLDVAPRQVLIEANIAEVTLSDSMSYGVRWFFDSNGGNDKLGINAPVSSEVGGAGLSFSSFSSSGNARAFIDLIATKTSVKFLSAPQVMVLDNHTANIRVGDQIPVTVRSSQGTSDSGAPVVSEVQFRDTGTLLTVTPRINAGGQVTLEISQEVSIPGSDPATGGSGNVSISQRTIDSSVVVQSGETVMLGGLILETHNEGRSGIPWLMDLPWIGNLFSTSTDVVFRTELIVMITPRVIESGNKMRDLIDEMRIKMKKAFEFGSTVESVDL